MTIQTSIPDLVFSSALPDVVVNSNASEVTIELWDEDEPLCFYSCNLFSFQKQVTVRNLASIVEEYMEKQQFSTLSVILRVNSPEGEGSVDVLVSGMSSIFSQLSTIVQAELEIQTAAIEKKYDREISLAEGNTYKVKKLEKQKETEIAKAKNLP